MSYQRPQALVSSRIARFRGWNDLPLAAKGLASTLPQPFNQISGNWAKSYLSSFQDWLRDLVINVG